MSMSRRPSGVSSTETAPILFLFVLRLTIRKAHPHSAEAKRRTFQTIFSKFSFLHCVLLRRKLMPARRV